MSRIGKKPILIPKEVNVKIDLRKVVVSGPKGELEIMVPRNVKLEQKDDKLFVTRFSEEKKVKALHGTIRQLIANAIAGVVKEWERDLEVVGTGYRAAMDQEKLILSVGFSHQVEIQPPAGIKIILDGQNKIKIAGVDKALVGREAAKIKSVRPPDAYKGKGIRYAGEVIKLKPGKAAKGGAAGVGK